MKTKLDVTTLPPKAAYVLGVLTGHGFESYVVGGFVRDSLRGHRPKDADIATAATPEQVQGLFPDSKRLETKQAYPVVMVDGIEVATFRLDVDAKSRHEVKTVQVSDYKQDAMRRDFTVNALYMDCEGTVLDPTGRGFTDLQLGYISFVGEPADRLKEDPLRAFRAVRFAARLGFTLDPRAWEAIRSS